MMRLLAALVLLIVGSGIALSMPHRKTNLPADPIPASRRTDWTHTGVPGGIPNRTTICATFSPGATGTAINSAIASCASGGVVFLNAGTYTAAALGGGINLFASGVTLRGAGPDQTIITGQNVINMGTGGNLSLGTAITAGGTQGSSTITVASTTSLGVGVMIELDRDDDTNLVVNTGAQGGGTRNLHQVDVITAINGLVVTLRNPLFYDFSPSTNPTVKWYFVNTQLSGVENMKFDHTGFNTGAYNFYANYCDSCWVKDVDSGFATGYHFVFLGTVNLEVRNSYIHDGATGPDNSGLNFYGNYLYGANSSAKVENNIFQKNFPAIELNGSTSGNYIGYNFSYGSNGGGGSIVTWTLDNGHAPFNIMNLYEGNISEQFGGDGFYGGSGYSTALRNYFSGYNPNFSVGGDSLSLKRLNYFYNIVGNVIGSTNQGVVFYDSSCSGPDIYSFGYPNLGNCSLTPADGFTPTGGYPDPKVAATLMRWGNYDYFNNAARFLASELPAGVPTPSSRVIPNSYYYSRTPSWWTAGIRWPPIGPDVTGGNGDTSGHVNKNPAQVCWENSNLLTGSAFSSVTCYGN